MKLVSICFLLLLSSLLSHGQENNIGFQIAPSYTFIVQNSDHNVEINFNGSKAYGLNLGAFYHLNHNQLSLRNSFDLQVKNHRFDFGTPMTDVNGNALGTSNNNQLNLNSVLSSILTYNSKSGGYVGIGLSANVLLYSFIRTEGINIQGVRTEAEIIRNYQYSTATFAIPFVLGYDWEFSNLYLKFSVDFTNRLPQESFVKQRENMIQIGYGITINRE